jgi:hypothetical protein
MGRRWTDWHKERVKLKLRQLEQVVPPMLKRSKVEMTACLCNWGFAIFEIGLTARWPINRVLRGREGRYLTAAATAYMADLNSE